MKIATLNCNGLRAALGHGLGSWMAATAPDILCLQETKVTEADAHREFFREVGYVLYLFPALKKGYSGTAVLSRMEPVSTINGINHDWADEEGRIQTVRYPNFTVVNAYFPSGSSGPERQEMKLQFLSLYHGYISELRREGQSLILCGDFNICHHEADIHNPIANRHSPGFTPEEREWMSAMLSSGFTDCWRSFHPDERAYTWWNYRFNARAKNLGWRIDYILMDSVLANRLKSCKILSEARFSDHALVMAECDV